MGRDNYGSKFLSYYNDDTKSGAIVIVPSCNDQDLPRLFHEIKNTYS